MSCTSNYTITWDVAWMSVSPATGVSAGLNDRQRHIVAFDTTGLTAGIYTGNITITDNAAGNSPVVVPVTLALTAVPAVDITDGRRRYHEYVRSRVNPVFPSGSRGGGQRRQ